MSASASGSALSWAGWAAKRKRAAGRAGLGCESAGAGRKLRGLLRTSQCWAAAKTGLGGWFSSFFFLFSNSNKTSNQVLNSNHGLNPNTQKQCTSMNATANSYISLIN
jgi:hypothetical protein